MNVFSLNNQYIKKITLMFHFFAGRQLFHLSFAVKSYFV
jgi:hypothetical protein